MSLESIVCLAVGAGVRPGEHVRHAAVKVTTKPRIARLRAWLYG